MKQLSLMYIIFYLIFMSLFMSVHDCRSVQLTHGVFYILKVRK